MNGETYRPAIETRRPVESGGGACWLVVVCTDDGRVRLYDHAIMAAAAELTDAQAVELSDA